MSCFYSFKRPTLGSDAATALLCSLIVLTMTASVPAMADEPLQARTVAVTGQADVNAEPDRAIVRLGVEARHASQREAQQEVEKVVRAFLLATGKLDIDKRHVKTAQLHVRPEYRWNKANNQQERTGYYVHRNLEVDLHDISKLGQLLDDALRLGVNQASPPQMESSRKDELLREALAAAARDARLNAEALAGALGATVGAVRQIRTSEAQHRPPPQPMLRSAAMAEGAKAADTYNAGEIEFSVTVHAEFDLEVR